MSNGNRGGNLDPILGLDTIQALGPMEFKLKTKSNFVTGW